MDKLGYTVIIVLVSGLLWVPFSMKYADMKAHHEIRNQERAKARQEISQQMKKSCVCWFNDSRCNTKGAVLACTKPEWM